MHRSIIHHIAEALIILASLLLVTITIAGITGVVALIGMLLAGELQ